MLHAALDLTVVLWVLSPLKALAFVAVQQAVFSLYLGISFAPNYKGMPIIESATATGFARRQVVTARNIRGGWFTTFMLGGLNYQIEHHLFESMPRPNLRRFQGLVRDFCAATDLGYSEESFAGSFRQIVHHLSDAGAAACCCPDGADTTSRSHGVTQRVKWWCSGDDGSRVHRPPPGNLPAQYVAVQGRHPGRGRCTTMTAAGTRAIYFTGAGSMPPGGCSHRTPAFPPRSVTVILAVSQQRARQPTMTAGGHHDPARASRPRAHPIPERPCTPWPGPFGCCPPGRARARRPGPPHRYPSLPGQPGRPAGLPLAGTARRHVRRLASAATWPRPRATRFRGGRWSRPPAPVLATGGWLVAEAVQPASHSPIRKTISVLAGHAGTDRWIMTGALFLVGGCQLVTAAGLAGVRVPARILLAVAGLSSIGIAASPEPAHGLTPQHLAWTALGAVALAVWPAFVARRAPPRPLILGIYGCAAVTAVFIVLLGWLVIETQGGTDLGLAERLFLSTETCWPFIVAIALRQTTRPRADPGPPVIAAVRSRHNQQAAGGVPGRQRAFRLRTDGGDTLAQGCHHRPFGIMIFWFLRAIQYPPEKR